MKKTKKEQHNFYRMHLKASEEAKYRDNGPEMDAIIAILATMLTMHCVKIVVRRFDISALRQYAGKKTASTPKWVQQKDLMHYSQRWAEIYIALSECEEYNNTI